MKYVKSLERFLKIKSLHKLIFKIVLIFIIWILTIPHLTLISTYYHELGHIDTAHKYNINLTYNLNISGRGADFYKLGLTADVSIFNTERDKEKFLVLEQNDRKEILIAGIKSYL